MLAACLLLSFALAGMPAQAQSESISARLRGVLAASGNGDDITLVVGNRELGVRKISVSGLPPGKTMHAWIWNWEGKGQLMKPQDVRVDEHGQVKIAGARLAITVLTTK